MGSRGIIFDFNGTLFWDTDKHWEAWRLVAVKMRGRPMTDAEMRSLHGRPNSGIVPYLLGKTATPEEIEAYGREKERVYRALCLADPAGMQLAPGAEALLYWLRDRKIPRTIATSSERVNLAFFLERFNLARWFDPAKIIHDDGTYPGKPSPDIYLRAAAALGLMPSDCIVCEDAHSGLEAARRAGIGRIVAVGPQESHGELSKVKGVAAVIADFAEFQRGWLEG